MADQNTQFYAILTNVGAAKQANADALGVPWKITQMGVGDANGTEPTPNATQTRLINEWRRAPLNQLKVDEKNNAIIVAEQVIPAEVGGKWIREIALYDADGDMIAVANCPPTFKPLLNQGSGRTQVVRMNLLVSSSSNVELKIDPAVVLATREYVDSRITGEINKLDNKQSVRVATTGNIALTGLQTVDGVLLVDGDRVLVKNQTATKDNGLYVAAADAWVRAADADDSSKVTSALIVSVEQGTTLADTRWQLVTDGAIVLGSTALVFQNITQGFAPINSPALQGSPTCPTPAQFDTSKSIVNAEFVQRALGSMRGSIGLIASKDLTAADVGKRIELAPGVTITLPPTSTVPDGATFLISTQAAATAQVRVSAGDILSICNIPVPTPRQLAANSDFYVVREANVWRAHLGTETLRTSSLFGSQLSSSGYQKLPSGLILQWGMHTVSSVNGNIQVFPYPIRFPNNCLQIIGGRDAPGSAETMHVGKAGGDPAGQLIMQNFSISAELGKYIAIGY
ncbi:phage tail protein [Pseudomonas mosselii]|uniref:phage tail protein n=1 Tax=Pseudomonas mosselii TaxID=78327 RepID=UPI00244D354D|nr:phage tail protein [Pseudomonas mosselii]MDH1526711.1 phage tail protein [Pseudomonas mosselii]